MAHAKQNRAALRPYGSQNDVHSDKFESMMDTYFTLKVQSDWRGRYQRMDKSDMRSALAPTRPMKYANKGILGVRSPVTKD